MRQALLVIDLQNDYFPGGKFPLWEAEAVLDRTLAAIGRAQGAGLPVLLVQHVASSVQAPFFQAGTEGVALHPRLLAAASDAPVIVKHHADAFHETDLAAHLQALGVTDLLVCGMMTQNCVTHTVLSRQADAYAVTVIPELCTTVDPMIHGIALNALSTRTPLRPAQEAL